MTEAYKAGTNLMMDESIFESLAGVNGSLRTFQKKLMVTNKALEHLNILTKTVLVSTNILANSLKNIAASVESANISIPNIANIVGGGYNPAGGGNAGTISYPINLTYNFSRATNTDDEEDEEGDENKREHEDKDKNKSSNKASKQKKRSYAHYDTYMPDETFGVNFGYPLFGDTVLAAGKIDVLKNKMLASGFSATQVSAAMTEADKLRRTIPGTFIGGNLQELLILKTQLGSVSEAMRVLPTILKQKLTVTLASNGKIDYNEWFSDLYKNINDMAKAGEQTGDLINPVTHKADPVRLAAFTTEMAGLQIATGRIITPAGLRALAKNATPKVMAQLTDPSLFGDLAPLILSMGGAQAGSALNDLALQFKSGKISQASAMALHNIGLLPDDMFGKNGKLLKKYQHGVGMANIPPGALPDYALYAKSPAAWLMRVLIPALEKHGYTSTAEQQKELYKIISSSNVSKGIHGLIANLPQIKKYYDEEQQGKSQDNYTTLVKNNPLVQLGALNAAMNALMIKAGQDWIPQAIQMINSMTAFMNAVGKLTKSHPKATNDILDGIALGSVGSLGLGVVGFIVKPYAAAFNLLVKAALRVPDAFKFIVKSLKRLGGPLKFVWRGLMKGIDVIMDLFEGLGEVLAVFLEVLVDVGAGIVGVIGAIPLAIAAVVALIVAAGAYLYFHWKQTLKFIQAAWRETWSFIVGAVDYVGDQFKKIPALLEEAGDAFMGFIHGLLKIVEHPGAALAHGWRATVKGFEEYDANIADEYDGGDQPPTPTSPASASPKVPLIPALRLPTLPKLALATQLATASIVAPAAAASAPGGSVAQVVTAPHISLPTTAQPTAAISPPNSNALVPVGASVPKLPQAVPVYPAPQPVLIASPHIAALTRNITTTSTAATKIAARTSASTPLTGVAERPVLHQLHALATGGSSRTLGAVPPPRSDYTATPVFLVGGCASVHVANPSDIHNAVAQSFAQQLDGIQTGPTGHDSSFGIPTPAGAW